LYKLDRSAIYLRWLMKPTSRRIYINRKGIFNKPMKVIPDNKYWTAKYNRLQARFSRWR